MSVVANPYTKAPMLNGRKDLALADALTKVSPEAQKKTRAKAEEFESSQPRTLRLV